MKAVVCVPGGTEVAEVPDPAPGPGELVVQVDSCGLCGSDVHAVEHGTTAEGQILGHEFAGRVVALGAGVTGWRDGDPVAVDPLGSCGTCRACARGVPFICPAAPNIGIHPEAGGAYAEYIAVPASQAVRLPAELPVWLGSAAEPLAVAMNAVKLARLAPGDRVLVYGAGPIGLNAIIALKLAGVEHIVAAGRSRARRAAAEALGVTDVIDTRAISVPDYSASTGVRFTAVLECSGAPNASDDALAVLEPAGVLVELGVVSHLVSAPIIALVGNGTTIVGSCAFDHVTYQEAVDAIASGQAPVGSLVSERVDLAGTPDALYRLRSPGDLVRVLCMPGVAAGTQSAGTGTS